MVHGDKLVPITREVLRQFYAKHPLEAVPVDEAAKHCSALDSALIRRLERPGSKIVAQVALETPKRIDDNFWRTRMYCEEAAHSLRKVSLAFPATSQARQALETLAKLLTETEQAVRNVQDSNTAAAAAQIKNFLPQDFRASLIEMKRTSQEKHNAKAVDDLVKKGGSIRQKYELLLKQQWERREALVQMGNLSGIYKVLVKYLGGIPQVLLDFAKEINAKLGPMEEQRLKYGPDLYEVTSLGDKLNVACAVWADVADSTLEDSDSLLAIVEPATAFFCHHLRRVVEFLGVIFTKSPFFITQHDAEEAAHAAHDQRIMDGAKSMDDTTLVRGSVNSQSALGVEPDSEPEAPQPHCAASLLAAVGLVPHSHGSLTAGRSSQSRRSSVEDIQGSQQRHSRHSVLDSIPFLRPSQSGTLKSPQLSGTLPASVGAPTVTLPTSTGTTTTAAAVGPMARQGSVGSEGHAALQTKQAQHLNWVSAEGVQGVVTQQELRLTSVRVGMVGDSAAAAAPAGASPSHVTTGALSGQLSNRLSGALSGHWPGRDLATTSAEFFSCCDNTSWVSSVQYQHGLSDEDGFHDMIQDRNSAGQHRYSLNGAGNQHPTTSAGVTILPTVFSEGGLEQLETPSLAPKHQRRQPAGLSAVGMQAVGEDSALGAEGEGLGGTGSVAGATSASGSTHSRPPADGASSVQGPLSPASGTAGQSGQLGTAHLSTAGSITRVTSSTVGGMTDTDVGSVWSRDGSAHVNIPARMGGVGGAGSEVATYGGSVRTLEAPSQCLTSVLEEGHPTHTSQGGVDDSVAASTSGAGAGAPDASSHGGIRSHRLRSNKSQGSGSGPRCWACFHPPRDDKKE